MLRACALLVPAALPGHPARADAPRVLATIKPVHSLVAAVMQGVGTPALLVGGGSDAHSFSLKPSDAQKIAGAGVVFWIGPDLETFLVKPLATLAPHANAVALEHAPGIALLPARRGGLWEAETGTENVNPHVWLSPVNAMAMTRAIAAALEQSDPSHRGQYAANAAKRIETLRALDLRIATALGPLHGKGYIVFHDAYPYFEARYGLTPLGAVTVAPDRPVGPRRIATLHAVLASGQAKCIFREPEFPPELIQTLTEGTPARTGVLDPVGAAIAPGPSLYDRMIESLATALKSCLGN
jgi:zinc transport system substrate-binding protein